MPASRPALTLVASEDGLSLSRAGKSLRGAFDRVIGASSLVSNAPVLDVRDFAWTEILRANWQAIRDEARAIAPPNESQPFFLWGDGRGIEASLARCPVAASVVARIPDINSAFFSILGPGTHIPPHRGMTKGLLTCHLGLIVPRDGDARMRVKDRMVRWAEGETLLFDDTCDHEAWNDTSGARVVLLIQVRRPLSQPGRWLADMFLKLIRHRPCAPGRYLHESPPYNRA